MKKILPFLLVLIIIISGIYLFKISHIEEPIIPKANEVIVNSVVFNCLDNKNIKADFYSNKVDIFLSDNRRMTLIQGMSASGVRYTSSDESFVFWNKGNTAFLEEKDVTTFKDCSISLVKAKNNQTNKSENKNTLANPASVNCAKIGGNLKMEKNGNGDEYGLCYFEDNRACEEWALLRGECPMGGVNTTGYDTIDQKYCAWSGGQTTAIANSLCALRSGTKCTTLDFYNNKCFSNKITNIPPVVCPMIAKLCSDGSSVGPTGPNCDFVCP